MTIEAREPLNGATDTARTEERDYAAVDRRMCAYVRELKRLSDLEYAKRDAERARRVDGIWRFD